MTKLNFVRIVTIAYTAELAKFEAESMTDELIARHAKLAENFMS